MKVCIDPGHGGSQPGAVGYFGTKEKDITLQVALQLRDVLKNAGVEVVMTRDSDKDVRTAKQPNELQARCDVANNSKADVFVSVHCNAADDRTAHGTETWYYPKDAKSKTLAQFIQTELVKQIGLRDRGVKQGKYYVTRYTKMPAVLVELAFISNPEEEVLLRNKSFQRKCAVGIANGVLRFLGMPLIKEVQGMKDVPQTHWAYKYIKELYDLGIVQGDEKGYFYPDKPATKGEVATMIAKMYEKIKGVDKMHDAVIRLLYDIIAVLVPILVAYLVAWIQKKLGSEKVQKIIYELETKKELARIAVMFVQQAYKDLGGPAKYEKAAAWLSDMSDYMGLDLTPEEIKALIEAALKELKAELGEAWEDFKQ